MVLVLQNVMVACKIAAEKAMALYTEGHFFCTKEY